MSFVDAYLGLGSVVGPGSITECALPGYSRQPIAFGEPVDGITVSTVPFHFGMALRHGAAGRAIFDAPIGGNLLLVLPFPIPLASGRLPWDSGDAGFLRLAFAALASVHRGASYTGRIAAGAVAGLCSDAADVINQNDITQSIGNPRLLTGAAPMTAGVALSINRGVLQGAATVPAGVE